MRVKLALRNTSSSYTVALLVALQDLIAGIHDLLKTNLS